MASADYTPIWLIPTVADLKTLVRDHYVDQPKDYSEVLVVFDRMIAALQSQQSPSGEDAAYYKKMAPLLPKHLKPFQEKLSIIGDSFLKQDGKVPPPPQPPPPPPPIPIQLHVSDMTPSVAWIDRKDVQEDTPVEVEEEQLRTKQTLFLKMLLEALFEDYVIECLPWIKDKLSQTLTDPILKAEIGKIIATEPEIPVPLESSGSIELLNIALKNQLEGNLKGLQQTLSAIKHTEKLRKAFAKKVIAWMQYSLKNGASVKGQEACETEKKEKEPEKDVSKAEKEESQSENPLNDEVVTILDFMLQNYLPEAALALIDATLPLLCENKMDFHKMHAFVKFDHDNSFETVLKLLCFFIHNDLTPPIEAFLTALFSILKKGDPHTPLLLSMIVERIIPCFFSNPQGTSDYSKDLIYFLLSNLKDFLHLFNLKLEQAKEEGKKGHRRRGSLCHRTHGCQSSRERKVLHNLRSSQRTPLSFYAGMALDDLFSTTRFSATTGHPLRKERCASFLHLCSSPSL